ncbi:MAG: hypothetical protein LBU32_00830 [Clostridiales bacterium]|nr:hypothetical protein [Clostridiales bacterium]
MEEAQRYFFSAASHELKTPIAATSVLLEGVIENIGDYKDHPKYLRECVKMMDVQSELVSDIMEIVSLSSRKILPVFETLDIGQVFVGMLPDYQVLCDAKGQRIITNIPDRASLPTLRCSKRCFPISCSMRFRILRQAASFGYGVSL